MALGIFDSLLGKKHDEPFIAVDIGTSAVKLMSIDIVGDKYKLVAAGIAALSPNCIANNSVSKPDYVAQAIRSVIETNEIKGTRAIIALPGPAVFTKKISIAYSDLKTLAENIAFEAGNYIPHSIDAVHLDFQVLKANGTSSIDVLLVAVKNEIINSYLTAIERAGLQPTIADVDYFALQNLFEFSYPEELEKTLALINIGARYSSICILQDGEALFYGDVGVGGRLYTEALCESLGVQAADAEKIKAGMGSNGQDPHMIGETLDRTTEHIASELHRQLGFFWSAAATDRSIEAIYVCGGSVGVAGLLDELGVRTGMVCSVIEPFRAVDFADRFDSDYINEIKLSMSISVGLAVRRLGDKKHAIR